MTTIELAEGLYLAFCRSVESRKARRKLGQPDFDDLDPRRRAAWVETAKEARSLLHAQGEAPEVHHIVRGASA